MDSNLELIGDGLVEGCFDPRFCDALIARLGNVSAVSTHPLGFLRWPLGACSRGLVYLHCWPGHNGYIQSPSLRIHQHSVAVTSFVIIGQLHDVAFDWIDDSAGDRRLLAQNRTGTGPRLLRTERIGGVVRRLDRFVQAGQHYTIPPDVFHETRIDWDTKVMTVAMFVGKSERPPLVAAPLFESGDREYQAVTIPLTMEEALRREACAGLLVRKYGSR